MTDSELRRLERAFHESGSPEAEVNACGLAESPPRDLLRETLRCPPGGPDARD